MLDELLDSNAVSLHSAAVAVPDDFILRSGVCSHPNIAVLFDVTMNFSGPMLVTEKVETSLSNLMCDVGHKVTTRERVDLVVGVVSAVDYLHSHLGIVHGLLNTDTIFFTSQLTAKVLHPAAALLLNDELRQFSHSPTDDVGQLGLVLLQIFEGSCLEDNIAFSSLQSIVDRMIIGLEDLPLSHVLSALWLLRTTKDYLDSPAKRLISCEISELC